MVDFGCYLIFCRIVIYLTHFPIPFSILFSILSRVIYELRRIEIDLMQMNINTYINHLARWPHFYEKFVTVWKMSWYRNSTKRSKFFFYFKFDCTKISLSLTHVHAYVFLHNVDFYPTQRICQHNDHIQNICKDFGR